MASALGDIKILDLTDPLGHYAGYLLANLGAEVTKVEPPGGDPSRKWEPLLPDTPEIEAGMQFLLMNVGKKGITLDIRVYTFVMSGVMYITFCQQRSLLNRMELSSIFCETLMYGLRSHTCP